MLYRILGPLIGYLDQLYSYAVRFLAPKHFRFFSHGWGHPSIAFDAQEVFLRQCEKKILPLKNLDEVEWLDEEVQGHVVIKKGRFLSPLAQHLPGDTNKYAYFYLVEPVKPLTKKTMTIMCPATGEMGKRSRMPMAKRLASEQGCSSIILTAPYYGIRKPQDQTLWFINTVQDLLVQSLAIIAEASGLAALYAQQDYQICLTGFSWGGAMCSVSAAAALLMGVDGPRLACVPYAGCASPKILADGILSHSIDYEALRRSSDESLDSISVSLQNMLGKMQLTTVTDRMTNPSKQQLRVIRSVSMEHDRFIKKGYVQDFFRQLGGLCGKANFCMLPGGHVFAALARPFYHERAVVAAIDDLRVP